MGKYLRVRFDIVWCLVSVFLGVKSYCFLICCQAVNLRGFCASMNPRFKGGIPDFMGGIQSFMDNLLPGMHFNAI